MRHTTFKSAALSLAVAGMASAQTWSLCNPVEGDDCKPNPAFGGAAKYDFTTATKLDDLNSFFTVDPGVVYNDKQMSFDGGAGASMIIFEESNAPTLTSKEYLFFGKVECVLRASPGQGIITSIVLQSDALDEIDWEFIGGDHTHVQTNYFHLGKKDYTYGRKHELPFNAMDEFHAYTIEWTQDAITFSIDGNVVRTATPAEGSYPQTPMQLKLGTWVGGKGGKEQQGTIDWAGGLAQWDQAPFAAHYQKFHAYTIEWTQDAITFSVDGNVVRTATPAEGSYPQTPMQLKLGTWVGGKGGKEHQGTIDWAGGLAQWDQAPFAAHYQKVTIQDYAGGKKAAREYVYTKGQGSWESIKVVGGKESDAGKFKDTTEDPVKSETSSTVPSATSKLPSSAAASASASISAVVSSIEDVLSSIVKTSTISSAPVSSSLPANTTTIRTTSSAATTLTSAGATTTTGAAAAQSSAVSVEESAATHMQASALVLTLAAVAGVFLW
ncbi:hypothetical protein BN1723_006594 [Verticillium longisporum]|uniref:Crh-like protein n=1 Tax=Verticillium longisporum TaxID=100787 RepID=A0A0G4NFV7_VERLO|nr:hypothetical protein BN1723_006594 [Verticillium longisporum]